MPPNSPKSPQILAMPLPRQRQHNNNNLGRSRASKLWGVVILAFLSNIVYQQILSAYTPYLKSPLAIYHSSAGKNSAGSPTHSEDGGSRGENNSAAYLPSISEEDGDDASDKAVHPLSYENEEVVEADLLYNACLGHNGAKHTISYRGIFGSFGAITANRSHHDSMNLATKNVDTFAVVSRAESDPIVNKTATALALDVLLRRELPPVMFAPQINNPAHCVQDVLFTLLPMAYRGELSGVIGVAVEHPVDDYCVLTLNALGWFEKIQLVPKNTCFEKLWVPACMHYRFPRGRSRTMVDKSSYLHETDLPLEMMRFFQQEMWRGLLSKNTFESTEEDIILIETRRRTTSQRRMLNSSVVDALQSEIGRSLPGVVVRILEDAGHLTLQQQAALYHSAKVLVTPHSGSNANAVFMKPKSHVFEISCSGDSWMKEWIIDLDITHSTIIVDAPECSNHNERILGVRPERLIKPILDAYSDSVSLDDGNLKADGNESSQIQNSNTSKISHNKTLASSIDSYINDENFLSTSESSAHYFECKVRFEFGDKQDHARIDDITAWFDREGLCTNSTVFFVGGLNEGQLAGQILNKCPNATLHGAEIQPDIFEKVKANLIQFPYATAHNQGWSDGPGELFIAGEGQTAHLVDLPTTGAQKVRVDTLVQFATDLGVNRVSYAVIDTEGHEPLIIKGMALEKEANRMLFPLFQFEVGSGWDQFSTSRWDQHKTALHLEKAGYELYLIGEHHYWRVHAAFFERGVGSINTFGKCNTDYNSTEQMFVWGNALAIHSIFAPKGVLDVVRESAINHAKGVRSIRKSSRN